MAGTNEERERLLAALAETLHDMCQPLTALYCRLEIGQQGERSSAPEGGSPMWMECLRECERLTQSVSMMRTLIRQAQANEHGRNR
jgi:hypothetical protein